MNIDNIGSTAIPCLFIILWVGFFVGMIFFIINSLKRAKAERIERMKDLEIQAKQLGMSFTPEPAVDMVSGFKNFNIFSLGRGKKIENIFEGTFDDIPIQVFDYQYTVSGGRSSTTYRLTVGCVYMGDILFPKFSMGPEYFFHKWGDAFGFTEIDFESHPNFSDRYLLKGPDEKAVREIFTPKILDYFQNRADIMNVEAEEDKLIIYAETGGGKITLMNRPTPEEIPDFMKEVALVARMFRESQMGF